MLGRVLGGAFDRFLERLRGRPRTNLSGAVARVIGDTSLSNSTLPLLSMGRDIAGGRMTLAEEDGQLELDWTTRASSRYFERVRREVTAIARAMGAEEVIDDPLSLLERVITVHPLGGCPMGRDQSEGVVSPVDGEVFGRPGLHVVDGSVMPSAVGPNPSLTIAALADHFADGILGQQAGHGYAGAAGE